MLFVVVVVVVVVVFVCLFFVAFLEKIRLAFHVSRADYSHEKLSLIFSEK